MPILFPERQRRVMYRAERLDVHFNVKVTRETRAGIRAAAVDDGMRDADFARRLIGLGLASWRAGARPIPQRVTYGSGVLLDFQMRTEMRSALSAGATAEDVSVSDFARTMMSLGLAIWRAGRAPNIRTSGAT